MVGCGTLLVDFTERMPASNSLPTSSGAKSVDAIVTHALFPPELVGKLFEAGIRSVKSTNSVPHPTNAVALDQVLADALRKEYGA